MQLLTMYSMFLANVSSEALPKIVLYGTITVFIGLMLIAGLIYAFRLFIPKSNKKADKKISDTVVSISHNQDITEEEAKRIPEDVLIALSATVELYKRLHMGEHRSKITFRHGKEIANWKTGIRYGHRFDNL